MEEAPIDHIPYPATTSLQNPEKFQAWLDAHGDSTTTVATEKVDGSNTVFWLGRGSNSEEDGDTKYTQVALFSRYNVVYVTHVYDDESREPATIFQADLKKFPVPTGQILMIAKREPLLQRLALAYRSFIAARPECTEVMICGETTHPKISKKIAYSYPEGPRFVCFGLQFRLADSGPPKEDAADEEGEAPSPWFWSDWHEGRKHLTEAGLEHVRELEDVPRKTVAELREYADNRISDYVDPSTAETGERRGEGVVLRTRGEVSVDEAQLVKFVRGSYGIVPAKTPSTGTGAGAKKVTLKEVFESAPMEEWIQHANGHGLFYAQGENGGDSTAFEALVKDVHKEVLQRAKARDVGFNDGQALGVYKFMQHALRAHYEKDGNSKHNSAERR